ncbi:MAG: glycosyltransferase [Alphaproteobacteria bacterium]
MASVVVAVPTFRRRRGLERLLSALAQLETREDVLVLVADNDAEKHEGLNLCQKLREAGYRWPLEVIMVPARGIAQARNALVGRALAYPHVQYVAMLDDDEWPHPQWLDAFLRVQRDTGAQALHGTVISVFESAAPAWAPRCKGLAHLRKPTGRVPMIEGTSNVLFMRACLESMSGPWFDPLFALTGGEDKDFFVYLRERGCRFAWADEAVAYAYVPASRTNWRWVLQRAYRTGNSDMRVFLKHPQRAAAFAGELVKMFGALLLAPILLAMLAVMPNRRADIMCKLVRAAGKFAAFCGRDYKEYAVTHGA